MRLTAKQIKFFKNIFTQSILLSLLTIIIFLPLATFLLIKLNIYRNLSLIELTIMSILIWAPIFFGVSPITNKIYQGFFDIIESENLTFIQALKLAIKRTFCSHLGYEAEIKENPTPLHFLDIKAKCSQCGAENYEINKRAHENYKLRLADDVLFQRNIEKFPEFYRDKAQQMNLDRGK
jgi:hypothetical protein